MDIFITEQHKRDMNFKHLRHFVAIVEHGSFLAAAEAISLSQPALSRSLQKLEDTIGTTLLERTTRGIQITQAGEQFYRRAKLILLESDKALNDIKYDGVALKLEVGFAPLFAGFLLPKALQKLTEEFPNLSINAKSGLFSELIKDLSSGSLDLLLTNLPFTKIPDDLVVEPLMDIEVNYMASSSHPLAHKMSGFEDLCKYPWAVVDEKHANELYDYIFKSTGTTQSPISLKTNSLTLLKKIIHEPPYITLLPKHMVLAEISENVISVLKTEMDSLTRKGGVIYRKTDILSLELSRLLQLMRVADS